MRKRNQPPPKPKIGTFIDPLTDPKPRIRFQTFIWQLIPCMEAF